MKAIPVGFHSPDGDIATLLRVFDEVARVYEQVIAAAQRTNGSAPRLLERELGLARDGGMWLSSMRKYVELEAAIDKDPDIRLISQSSTVNWERVGRALLAGYGDHVWARSSDFNGAKLAYFNVVHDRNGKLATVKAKRRGLFMGGSVIAPSFDRPGPELVVSLSFMYGTQDSRVGMMGLAGVIQPSWATQPTQRTIELASDDEVKLLQPHLTKMNADIAAAVPQDQPASVALAGRIVTMNGPLGKVYALLRMTANNLRLLAELDLEAYDDPKYKKNLADAFRFPKIFDTLKWRWENSRNVRAYFSMI